MIIDTRQVACASRSNKKFRVEHLIRCDVCANEKWYNFRECSGKNRRCSRRCSKVGMTHSDEWKRQMSERNSGENNPFFGRTHDTETLQRMSEKCSAAWTHDDYREQQCNRLAQQTGEKNPFFGKKHTEITRAKMSEARARGIAEGRIQAPRGIKGQYVSSKAGMCRYDSFYEFLRMKMLDTDERVLSWQKHHDVRIPYEFEGSRTYVPDFLIVYANGTTLEELKGWERAEKLSVKLDAGKKFADANGWQFRFLDAETFHSLVLESFGRTISALREEFKCVVV